MFSVRIPMVVSGRADLKEKEENFPAVTFYVNTSFSTKMIRVPLSEQNRVDCSLEFDVKGESASEVAARLRTLQLNIDGVVVFRATPRQLSRKNAGGGEIMLTEVFAEPTQPHEVELRIGTLSEEDAAIAAPKMVVRVTPTGPVTVNRQPISMAVADLATVKEDRLKQRRTRFEILQRYMLSCHAPFTMMTQTFESTHDINCLVYQLRNTVTIPAVGYLMQRRPPFVDVKFFEHALEMILRRERNTTVAEFMALPPKHLRVCNIAAQLLCVWSNYAVYVSDQAYVRITDKKDNGNVLWAKKETQTRMVLRMLEQFELAELYDADDCEGLALIIIRLCEYLLDLPEGSLSPQLRRVVELLRHYANFLLLSGVTSADVGGDFAALTAPGVSLGAHMFTLMVPVGRAVRMMARCNRSKAIFPDLSPRDQEYVRNSLDLPIMYGEGTGPVAPLCIDLPERKHLVLPSGDRAPETTAHTYEDAAEREATVVYIDRNHGSALMEECGSINPAFSNNGLWLTEQLQASFPDVFGEGARKFFHMSKHPEFPPHFYRTGNVAFTSWTLRREYRVGAFMIVQRKRNTAGAKWSIGTSLQDLMREDDATAPFEIGLWPESEMNSTELDSLMTEMDNAPPVPPVVAAPDVLGENNNRWDPTARVDKPDVFAKMFEGVRAIEDTAARVTLRSLDRILKLGASKRYIGWPLALDSRIPEAAEAVKRVGGAQQLAAFGVTALTFIPEAHRLPLVGTFFFNRQQFLRRVTAGAFNTMLDRVISLNNGEVILFPVGVRVLSEQVTASVGGFYVQFSYLAQY